MSAVCLGNISETPRVRFNEFLAVLHFVAIERKIATYNTRGWGGNVIVV